MHDLSARTGPYLHAPDDLFRLRFETGGTPRLFTLLVARAIEMTLIDPEGAGIVILDEDEGRVLLDRHLGTDLAKAGEEVYRIRAMSWPEFSGFCRSHPRFRGGPADIVTPYDVPLPGSRRRQGLLGSGALLEGVVVPGDLRSALMISLDADPTCPIRFPTRDHDGLLTDLCGRLIGPDAAGRFRLGWPLMPPATPDLSGLSGDRPVDRSLDLLWEERTAQSPELVDEAWCGVLETFGSGRIRTPGAEDEGRFDLRITQTENGSALSLYALEGRRIEAETRPRLVETLRELPIRDLRDLWKLNRTLDVETGSEKVSSLFHAELNRVRSEVETSREADLAPPVP